MFCIKTIKLYNQVGVLLKQNNMKFPLKAVSSHMSNIGYPLKISIIESLLWNINDTFQLKNMNDRLLDYKYVFIITGFVNVF